ARSPPWRSSGRGTGRGETRHDRGVRRRRDRRRPQQPGGRGLPGPGRPAGRDPRAAGPGGRHPGGRRGGARGPGAGGGPPGGPAARETLRVLPMAVADLVGEAFGDQGLRAAVAARGVLFTAMGPWTAGTAAVLLADAAGNDGGAAGQTVFAEGGPGALAAALG